MNVEKNGFDHGGQEVANSYYETFYERLDQEHDPEFRKDLETTIRLAETVQAAGGRALVVGGYARDEALKKLGFEVKSKDMDIEVYGLELGQLTSILGTFGPLNVFGESFAIMKVGNLDVSIPRRDSKVSAGHTGFEIVGDPTMTIKEAAQRRDFTMNALALDPLTGQLIDEFGGLDDLRAGILRATDYELFGDDSLRVLRAMQFCGRFNLTVEPQTAEVCRMLDLADLPPRRIGDEWDKLLLKSPRPSIGMEVARKLGIIDKLHPELAALIDCPQDPEWHPEGDVWTHTKMVVDEAAAIIRREQLDTNEARVIMLATLCHDLGKPATTKLDAEKQRITAHGYESAGVVPAKTLLSQWEIDDISMPEVIKSVSVLVREHLYPAINPNPSDTAIRRLARRLQPVSIRELAWVAEANQRGRDVPFDGFLNARQLIDRATSLRVQERPTPDIVMGRHLIQEGLQPGKQFGIILKQLREAQDEGLFESVDDGLTYLRTQIQLTA